jgi:hypothetical protein
VFRRHPKLSKSEMLSSKPLRLSDAQPREIGEKKYHLVVPIRPMRIARFFLRVSKTATKTFELDPLGLFVWQHCDGKTPVRQLIRRLAKQYNLNDRAAEVATVQFLYTLAKKGLIGMQINRQ